MRKKNIWKSDENSLIFYRNDDNSMLIIIIFKLKKTETLTTMLF